MAFEKQDFGPSREAPGIWWRQLRNGEMKGLELIYDAFMEDMYQYGMGINPNSNFVKDCIQDVFVSLWKYRSNLKDTENIKAYLYRSLSNKIHREISQDLPIFHSQAIELSERLFLIDPFEQDWIREQGHEQTRKKLAVAMDKLPPRQKEAIHLLFFEGLPYEEVSTIMNVHIKSVYTLAWKALTLLRKNMISFPLIFLFASYTWLGT